MHDWKKAILCSLMIVCLPFASLIAQTDASKIQVLEKQLILSHTILGNSQLSTVDIMMPRELFAGERALSYREIQKELGLLESQVTKIKKAREKFEQSQSRLFAVENIEQKKAGFAKAGREFRVEIEEVLLPHQQTRLKQLMNRLNSRKGGVTMFLQSLGAENSSFEIGNSELLELKKIENDGCEEILHSSKELVRQLLRSFVKDRGLHYEKVNEADMDTLIDSQSFDSLKISLEIAKLKLAREEKEVSDLQLLEDEMIRSEYFLMQGDGQWKLVTSPKSVSGAIVGVIQKLQNGKYLKIDLVEEQQIKLSELSDIISTGIRENNEKYRSSRHLPDAQRSQMLDTACSQLADKARDGFFEILYKPQIDQLLQVYKKREKVALGILNPIASCGEREAVSSALEEFARLIDEVNDTLRKSEETLLQSILNSIETQDQVKLRELFGPQPTHLRHSSLFLRNRIDAIK
jgi:hypothetical protein